MSSERWQRYGRAIAVEALPVAIVDLDAFDANIERMVGPIRAAGKHVRVATKSVRCTALVERFVERAGAIGLMTYSAAETQMWAKRGVKDLVLAYPTLQAADAAALARANRDASAAVIVDDAAHLPPLAAAARAEGVRIPVWIDVDMSWRPLGVHIGVRRSPLRDPAAVVDLARAVAAESALRFAGVMGYEAQLAGLPDRGAFRAWQNLVRRVLKRGSKPTVADRRDHVIAALSAAGLRPEYVNGGGSGSVDWSSSDPTLTEITIGSGALCGHLFDGYRGLDFEPALAFALQVVRRPAPGIVTCLGGGWIASGAAGADRLPLPCWPHGAALLPAEGAGEVQTPVALPRGVELPLGSPVWFRPAKSGELAEHVSEYLLVRGDRIVDRVPTYRAC